MDLSPKDQLYVNAIMSASASLIVTFRPRPDQGLRVSWVTRGLRVEGEYGEGLACLLEEIVRQLRDGQQGGDFEGA